MCISAFPNTGRRQFALGSGLLFGIGWLVFLDSVAYNNFCIGGIKSESACMAVLQQGVLWGVWALPGTNGGPNLPFDRSSS